MKIPLCALWFAVALVLSGWLALVLLEGDACVDAGGSFARLTLHCDVGQHYVPLVERSHRPFWITYGAVSVFISLAVFALFSLVAKGLRLLGLRSCASEGAKHCVGQPSPKLGERR